MRAEFNNLVETLKFWDLYQIGDEVDIAISELEDKITEVEKRLECVSKTNKDISHIPLKYEHIIPNNDFELLERSVNDINIAIDLNDKEPIENNWYGLFEEPKKEEPKVLIPKGSIIKWRKEIPYYSAKGGAKAKLVQDYTTETNFVFVEWIDELKNGQENGGYDRNNFEDEVELPTPTELCKTPQTHEFVKDIIAKLKVIDVDGETMQYILKEVGMEDQMLRQLIMSNPESDTKDLLEEKRMISDEQLSSK
jgi:hypothetical protein